MRRSPVLEKASSRVVVYGLCADTMRARPHVYVWVRLSVPVCVRVCPCVCVCLVGRALEPTAAERAHSASVPCTVSLAQGDLLQGDVGG